MDKDTVKEVRIALIRREWTQSELARQIGVSAAYLSLIMKGHRSVPDMEVRILETLGLSLKMEEPSGTPRKDESRRGLGDRRR
ncbi:MAG: helix-turn-helix domain-containing protein [Leptospirillia bacterium]